MALPSSGTISVSDILTEGQVDPSQTASLKQLAQGDIFTINTNSPSYPSSTSPFAISDWYGYNHSAQPSSQYYWDLSNDIKWDNATDRPLASTTEDFSASLWIRPQWTATDLNLIIFDLTPAGTTATSNRFFFQYDYGFNRLIAKYRSNSTNFDRQWALHSNNAATGTGTSSNNKWTANNRGNVNSDGFCNLVLSYDASQTSGANAFKLYWNGTELTNTAASNNGSRSNLTLTELTFCGNDHNTGGSRIADYMYMHMWDQVTSSTNASTMYNSGTPISASDAGYTTNLIFGDTSTSVPSVNDPDNSGNYDFMTANGQSVVQL
jgi:hypothetical protein